MTAVRTTPRRVTTAPEIQRETLSLTSGIDQFAFRRNAFQTRATRWCCSALNKSCERGVARGRACIGANRYYTGRVRFNDRAAAVSSHAAASSCRRKSTPGFQDGPAAER